MPVYPAPNLDPNAAPWGRSVNDRLAALELAANRRSKDDININKQQNSSAQTLASQVANLTSVVNTLAAVSSVQYVELGAVSNFSGFYNGTRPTVTVTSITGRLEIGYGGSLNGGDGYVVYSVTNAATGAVVYSRDTIQANGAQRVAISGGASFAPSGYKSIVVPVPANVPLTVRLELFAANTFTYFFGSSLLVRVAP